MKVFLVGEGRHDIGDLAKEPPFRSGRPGFLQPVIESVAGSRVTFEGQKVSLIGKKRVSGLKEVAEKKAWMASLLAENVGADLLVYVRDLDKESGTSKSRRETIGAIARKREQIVRGCEAYTDAIRCVPGIPCRMIEAWAMGDLVAVAQVSDFVTSVKLPSGKGPEELWGERSDPMSDHPKNVLKRIFGGKYTQEDMRRVAELADIRMVRKKCPLSFEPFAAELEEAVAALGST